MSTYSKAWLFNGIWIGFFALFLLGFGIGAINNDDDMALPAVIGFLGYLLMVGLAQSFPTCRNCDEPVNMPYDDGEVTWQGVTLIRPDRPKRSCGFCGADLTNDQPD